MALKASPLKVGDTHTERVCENLSRTQIVQYAGASGDYNPLHSDEVYTTQVGRLPEHLRPRHADDGPHQQDADQLGRRRQADQVRRALHQPGLAGRHARREGDGGRDPSGERRRRWWI